MNTKFKGTNISTIGDLPTVGERAPNFMLSRGDLSNFSLSDVKGQRVVLNIFPSLDTSVCAVAVRKFNEMATRLRNVKVLCISRDLPFAQSRFCVAENIKNVELLSDFRYNSEFGIDYGVLIKDGPLAGLFARAVVVADEEGTVIYSAMNEEIAQEPNYDAVLTVLQRNVGA